MPFPCPYPGCSRGPGGKVPTYEHNLHQHLIGKNSPGHRLSVGQANDVIAQVKGAGPVDESRLPRTHGTPGNTTKPRKEPVMRQGNPGGRSKEPVRDGHRRALEQIEYGDGENYRTTLDMYAKELDGVAVYLRVTANGFTVMSLDHKRCKTMIGVSDRKTKDEYLSVLPPSASHVERACEGYVQKRDSLKRGSDEERYALRCIHHAVENGLQLPGSDYFFIHQEWRFGTETGGGKLDLLAVDPAARGLVVIELKASKAKVHDHDKSGRNAAEQAAHYAKLLHAERREYYPFFQRLARAIAVVYNAPRIMREVELDPEHMPMSVVWTPE